MEVCLWGTWLEFPSPSGLPIPLGLRGFPKRTEVGFLFLSSVLILTYFIRVPKRQFLILFFILHDKVLQR